MAAHYIVSIAYIRNHWTVEDFVKEGYQVQKVRIKKKRALGLRVVLKREVCDTGK